MLTYKCGRVVIFVL